MNSTTYLHEKDPETSFNNYLLNSKAIFDSLAAIGYPLSDKTKIFRYLLVLVLAMNHLLTDLGACYEVVPLLRSYKTRVSLYSSDQATSSAFFW